MSNISILIIEDEMIIAMDIESKLKRLGYDVAGICVSSEEAIDYLSFNNPDLVLCDIMIDGTQDGIEVAERFKDQNIPFVFLTSLADRPTLERAKKVVPYGYIVKPFTEKDILTTVEMALHKYASEIDQQRITFERINTLTLDPVTPKEYEVLQDIMQGMNNTQIATKSFVSINTVKHHVRNLLSKFGVKNRAELLHKIIEMLIG